jgi:hypothetical protein
LLTRSDGLKRTLSYIRELLLQGNGGGIGSGDSFAPDRTNNVEQVSVSYLPPGEVAIEVRLILWSV